MIERAVLFTGSRGWTDVAIAHDAMTSIKRPYHVIVGDAAGWDTIVWSHAAKLELPRLKFNYIGNLGRRGGHVRNDWMLNWLEWFRRRGLSTFVVSGWDGKSTGTAGCVEKAAKRGFDVWRAGK